MKTIIYYFTGTGNSLAAAKKIATVIGDCELIPIGSLMDTPGRIIPAAERVGIACPVYFYGLPAMVASFAGDGILRAHSSRGLDAGFMVKMPGNYIRMYESPSGEKRDTLLAAADNAIARVADTVRQCRKQELPRSFLEQLIHPLVYSWFISRVHGDDRKFTVSEKCTSCGICVAICPAENIELVDTKPVWKHRCESCCGCIHLCPVQAIQAGTGTEKRLRYRNPDITVAELKIRKEKRP